MPYLWNDPSSHRVATSNVAKQMVARLLLLTCKFQQSPKLQALFPSSAAGKQLRIVFAHPNLRLPNPRGKDKLLEVFLPCYKPTLMGFLAINTYLLKGLKKSDIRQLNTNWPRSMAIAQQSAPNIHGSVIPPEKAVASDPVARSPFLPDRTHAFTLPSMAKL